MKTIRIAASSRDQKSVHQMLDGLPLGDSIELVNADDAVRSDSPQFFLELSNGEIVSQPDWYNQSLPFLFPPLPFTRGNLLGLIFHHIGLAEDAENVAFNEALQPYLEGLYHQQTDDWVSAVTSGYFRYHNRAILSFFYGSQSAEVVDNLFHEALAAKSTDEYRAYTLKHYKAFLQQMGTYEQEASAIADRYPLSEELPASAMKALDVEDLKALVEYHQREETALSAQSKEALWKTVEFYRDRGARFLEAELTIDMAAVSLLDRNYAESIGYVRKAIVIYEEEGVDQLLSQALITKANIMHQWAKSGAPQFYQSAIEAYQKAVSYFRKEEAPYWFAEIHHRLGVLYAEMPEEQQKRAIWAAVSATSFQEALSFFTKENFPLEYAMVSHNYATALVNYPSAIKSDNIEKSIHFYNESLAIRDAESMPQERAMTLLNYVEASWEANNLNPTMENARLTDMTLKCEEAMSLSQDPFVQSRASEHLESIAALQKDLADDA